MNPCQSLTIIGRLRARSGRESDLRDALIEVLNESRQETGCINYDLHVAEADPSLFVLYENWISQDALDEHFQLPHSTKLAARFPELLAEPLVMERLIEISDYQARKRSARQT